MSIYTYLQKLEELTLKSFTMPLLPEIVAYKKNEKPYLYRKDNFLETLNKLDHRYIIDPLYWNYKYHKFDMLSDSFRKSLGQKIKVVVEDLELASFGYFLNVILFHNLLVNVYTLDLENLQNYLDRVNIDKNTILNLYLEHNYDLPFCENFYCLLKRILDKDNSEKVLDIVFSRDRNSSVFSREDMLKILESFNYGDINDAYLKITNHDKYTLETKLKYLKVLVESYNYTIDQEDVLYLSYIKGKRILGLYLYNLEIMGSLTNLYYSLLKVFLDKGGVKKIIIVDNPVLNNKINNRLLNYNF